MAPLSTVWLFWSMIGATYRVVAMSGFQARCLGRMWL
jgi:hypothetical protein